MSRPYISRHKHRDAQTSAEHILRVIDRLGAEDSGRFFNWDGKELRW